MDSPTGTATNATSPAVLYISSAVWLVLGVLGTLWSLLRLLLVMVMGGMLGPETYLATLALYLASGAVFVGCTVFARLLGRGRRLARLFLSAYVVILPALFSTPSYLGGTASDGGMPAVGVPWRDALLSPAGAAVLLAAAATVLMWLPPANAFISRGGAARLEDGGSGRVPSAVAAAAWILVVSGIVAALVAAFGLLLLTESAGSAATTTPALLLILTLAVVAVVNLACARGVRRGRRYVRPVVTVVPVAGLVLVVLSTVTQLSALPAGSPWAAGGPGAAILLTIFSQGLPVLGGLAAAGLIWLPSLRRYFHQSADVLPAGTGGS